MRKLDSQTPGNGSDKTMKAVNRKWNAETAWRGTKSTKMIHTKHIEQMKTKQVALRTIPIVLKNCNKRMLVSCFLDNGSDSTYINEDVVELGLQGQKEKITVNTANRQQVSFDSMTFTVGLESTCNDLYTLLNNLS